MNTDAAGKRALEKAIRESHRIQMGVRSIADILKELDNEPRARVLFKDSSHWSTPGAMSRAVYTEGDAVKSTRVSWIEWHKEWEDFDPEMNDSHRIATRWVNIMHDALVEYEVALLKLRKHALNKQYMKVSVLLKEAADEAGNSARLVSGVGLILKDI